MKKSFFPRNRPQAATTTTTTEAPRRRFRPSNSAASSKTESPSKQYKSFKSEQQHLNQPNPSVKAKLPRTQGRWSYKTTPKPRINIRKTAGDDESVKQPQVQVSPEQIPTSIAPIVTVQGPQGETEVVTVQRKEGDFDGELEEGESEDNVSVHQHQQQDGDEPVQPSQKILPIETINVEISTPADFNDIYFEIATMKSPYEFQVGFFFCKRSRSQTSKTLLPKLDLPIIQFRESRGEPYQKQRLVRYNEGVITHVRAAISSSATSQCQITHRREIDR